MKSRSAYPGKHVKPSCLVRLLLPASIALTCSSGLAHADLEVDRVIVHKAQRIMTLMSNGETIRRYTIALGGQPTGHKQREGDERTPEGIYTIDARNPESDYYLSLRISYPNENDVERAESSGLDPGGEIMIHGIGNAQQRTKSLHPSIDWTNGCVAVTDREMEEIWELVEVGTPIEILP